MPESDAEFLKRLLATFKVEAEEHIGALFSGVLALEAASEDERHVIIESIFREAHSLKGAARSVNLTEVESVCQNLESIFARLKRGEIGVSPGLLDELHLSLDQLRQLLPATVDRGPAARVESRTEPLSASLPVEERAAGASTVRIPIERLDALLLQAEELVSAKLTANQHAESIGALGAALSDWRKAWAKAQSEFRSVQQEHASHEQMDRVFQFIHWNEDFLRTFESKVAALAKPFERDRRALAGMVDALLDDMKQATMLPLASVMDLLRKLVRDLSRDQDKLVDFVMEGGGIRVDRRILEQLKDPLVHLVRNSIDHGIEKPAERERQGKPARGTVTVSAYRRDAKVEIIVTDDGRGIDLEKVKAAAADAGVYSADEAMKLSDREAAELIFRSGVSTSPLLTDISGRGLGLAIVEEKAERLGGAVSVQSRPGEGTTFSMLLPLTVSTFRGVVVRIDDQQFIMPTTHLERVVRVKREEIKTVENRETIRFQEQIIPVIRLADVLGVANAAQQRPDAMSALVVGASGHRLAFTVDEVLHEQEVLLKNLGKQLRRVRHIAGATILGTGRAVPVLNTADIIKSAARAPTPTISPVPAERKGPPKAVLVADDSITSRTLLKNILQANGYRVETAVDGVDAFTRLRSGEFAALVSDVEMPRMNGFELTARVRAEKKFAELPVVLVTALASAADRERGMDVGASAYIVKSSFDQSNLLEVLQRLV